MENQETPSRPSGPPPPRGESKVTFFDLVAKKSVFEYQAEDNSPYLSTVSVMGIYSQHWLEWDEGHVAARQQDSVEARWKLKVILDEAETEDGTRLGRAWVTVGPKSAFFGMAHGLLASKAGDFLGLRTAPGESSCFVDVSTWDGSRWNKKATPKAEDRSFEDRYAEVVDLIKKSPAYRQPEKKVAAATGQSGDQGGGTTEKRTPAPAAEVPAGKEAFAYVPTRWPLTTDNDLDATEKQKAMLVDFVHRRGFTDQPTGEIAEDLRATRPIFDAVLKAYGLSGKGTDTKAKFAIVLDWLIGATATSFSQAKSHLKAAEAPSVDEYDPFADE